jgi:hypothetical protein
VTDANVRRQPQSCLAMTASDFDTAREPQAVVRVELELTIGAEPIRGYVADAAGRRTFTGWVDLTSAIAAAHQRVTSGEDTR